MRKILGVWLFSLAIFLSACLLFLVQPMVGRMILPLLGGAASVWNTCMVFFQALLLAGYAYAHGLTSRVDLPWQPRVHVSLLLAGLLFLPVGIPSGADPGASEYPVPWLIATLALVAGVPFLVVSTTAPLLQRWYAETGLPRAHDPYFLYAASNIGSLAGLVSYPLLMEPSFRLADQARLWTGGYAVLLVLLAFCALFLRPIPRAEIRDAGPAPPWKTRFLWMSLAFVPSSLLLGETTYLTTDLASFPLLWIIPLSLYLLTYILAFAPWEVVRRLALGRRPGRVREDLVRLVFDLEWLRYLMPGFLILLTVLGAPTERISWLRFGVHISCFFVVCLYCHRRLARERPGAGRLPEYYLWLSSGGVLGGMFNALIAPVAFDGVYEFPLMLVAAGALVTALGKSEGWLPRALDVGFPILLAISGMLLMDAFRTSDLDERACRWLARVTQLEIKEDVASPMIGLLAVALVGYTLHTRPARLSLSIVALLFVAQDAPHWAKDVVYADRSFFGVMRVVHTVDTYRNEDGSDRKVHFYKLVHGTTTHGGVRLDARSVPTTYYYRTGPFGQVMEATKDRPIRKRVGIIGLGPGASAAYAQAGEEWTFFEIDPAIERIALNRDLFRYIDEAKARGVRVDVVLGDARLSLGKAERARFNMLVIDAFSSDVIPVHLLTKEAFELYLGRLEDDGLILVHISNAYFDLEPILAGVAHALGLEARINDSDQLAPGEGEKGKYASKWVALARRRLDLFTPFEDNRWRALGGRTVLWTDDFSNILAVLKK